MLKYIWLVPALPLLGAAINLFFGRLLGKFSGVLAAALVGGSFLVSVVAFFELVSKPAEERVYVAHLWDWFTSGKLNVGVDLRVDVLSMTMILVVTGIGFLIHIYSNGYMHGDERFSRFFAYMNLFVFFMLTLVLGQNFIVMFVGWEGVGLCSYLLIGFWFEKKSAANAAKKAFTTTRIGDTFFVVGLAMIFVHFGSFDFDKVLDPHAASTLSTATLTAISLLLFGGAIGKSAQIPLHVWLPDAMEGPTPVSALIHAATMVTAGVYLVVRAHVLFTPESLNVVMIIGLATALYAAIVAVGQDDIKRALAYSTLSQLGYMFFAAGMGAYSVAMFMLVAHAFYKALMFLSAGSVMHGLDGETDMKKMGGLRKFMPITAAVFMVGAISQAGIPPLAGFFAKDPILSIAEKSGRTIPWLLADIAAFLTALYIARVIFMTFFGKERGDKHAHESPKIMTAPLIVLAGGALVAGFLFMRGLLPSPEGVFGRWLEPVTGIFLEPEGGLPETVLVLLSIAIAVVGIWLAYTVYASERWVAFRERFSTTHRMLENAWYWDAAYGWVVERPGKGLARFAAFGIDKGVIDGVVNGLGTVTKGISSGGRRVQTGMVRTYAAVFLLGVVGVLAFLVVRS
jgi:NADH-quinone oxidoreductase subunit L